MLEELDKFKGFSLFLCVPFKVYSASLFCLFWWNSPCSATLFHCQSRDGWSQYSLPPDLLNQLGWSWYIWLCTFSNLDLHDHIYWRWPPAQPCRWAGAPPWPPSAGPCGWPAREQPGRKNIQFYAFGFFSTKTWDAAVAWESQSWLFPNRFYQTVTKARQVENLRTESCF